MMALQNAQLLAQEQNFEILLAVAAAGLSREKVK